LATNSHYIPLLQFKEGGANYQALLPGTALQRPAGRCYQHFQIKSHSFRLGRPGRGSSDAFKLLHHVTSVHPHSPLTLQGHLARGSTWVRLGGGSELAHPQWAPLPGKYMGMPGGAGGGAMSHRSNSFKLPYYTNPVLGEGHMDAASLYLWFNSSVRSGALGCSLHNVHPDHFRSCWL